MLNLLPGPVSIAPKVQQAFATPPIWHRSEAFLHTYKETKDMLCKLTKSTHVALLMGSGSLANAAVAQEIQKLNSQGLILANGEFGSRLIRQARQVGLHADIYDAGLGNAFSPKIIKERLLGKTWVWLVHCETSTGSMNWEPWFFDHCQANNIKICLDSISAVGSVDVDFSQIYLASSASGKGLESFAGIALVFYNHTPQSGLNAHEYLDINTYHNTQETPFTFSSPLLFALHSSLQNLCIDKKIEKTAAYAAKIEEILQKYALETPLNNALQCKHIWTLALPKRIPSINIGELLKTKGVLVHYKNSYLLENNWIQIIFMTTYEDKKLYEGLCLLEDCINIIELEGA